MDFSSASARSSLTFVEVSLEVFKLSINSISSKIFPLLLFKRSRIVSSFFFSYCFPSAIDIIKLLFIISTSGISLYTTSPNNYSSNPNSVTVKLITVVLMNISGKKSGLEFLVEMNNLKFSSKSILVSPKVITFLLFVIVKCFINKGSSIGSNYSSISSIKSGPPTLQLI